MARWVRDTLSLASCGGFATEDVDGERGNVVCRVPVAPGTFL